LGAIETGLDKFIDSGLQLILLDPEVSPQQLLLEPHALSLSTQVAQLHLNSMHLEIPHEALPFVEVLGLHPLVLADILLDHQVDHNRMLLLGCLSL